MSDFPVEEFMQDFLEESAEHLQSISRNLLALEASLNSGKRADAASVERVAVINELFRSFHTLKGLAGMVGLRPAEELSHAMESILRAFQRLEIEVTQEAVDLLLESTQALEMVIATLQNPNRPQPDTASYLAALHDLLVPDGAPPASQEGAGEKLAPPQQGEDKKPEDGPDVGPGMALNLQRLLATFPEIEGHLDSHDLQRLKAAQTTGKHISLAHFVPSQEKAERGETVNLVRQQLLEAATLVKAVPVILDGAIRFVFVLVSDEALEPARFVEMEWWTISPKPGEVTSAGAPAGASPAVVPPAPPTTPAPGLLGASEADHPAARLSPSVRVELSRLDELMRLVSDLVVDRSRISALVPHLRASTPDIQDDLEQDMARMERHLRDLRQAVMHTRMVPLAEVFGHMPLAVRDLARASGKELRLVVQGETVEVDKQLVDHLLDPLLHLVRNAIIHGIEPPEERRQAGKPPQGTLRISGQAAGDQVLITVEDDGRGLDLPTIASKAVKAGWLPAARLELDTPLSEGEALEFISRPGFSTHGEADLGAGRGVGMDVAVRAAHAMGGSLSLRTTPGQGSAFTLHLPLTLTIIDAILVRCGEERYAIPQSAVDEVIEIDPEQIVRLEKSELVPFRQDSLTLVRLDRLFKLSHTESNGGEPGRQNSPGREALRHRARTQNGGNGAYQSPYLYGLISSAGDRRTVLAVDRLIGLREVVVRPIRDPLVSRPGVAGATELGDGAVILILDLPALFQFAKRE